LAKKKKKAFLILIGQHTQLSSLQQSLDKYLYIRDWIILASRNRRHFKEL
jgi:hypothetical protein